MGALVRDRGGNTGVVARSIKPADGPMTISVIQQRNAARVAAGETDADSDARWMREEFPFVADQRPWERAFMVVAGTPELSHDPSTEVVLGPSPGRR